MWPAENCAFTEVESKLGVFHVKGGILESSVTCPALGDTSHPKYQRWEYNPNPLTLGLTPRYTKLQLCSRRRLSGGMGNWDPLLRTQELEDSDRGT